MAQWTTHLRVRRSSRFYIMMTTLVHGGFLFQVAWGAALRRSSQRTYLDQAGKSTHRPLRTDLRALFPSFTGDTTRLRRSRRPTPSPRRWTDAKALLMSAAACPDVKQDVDEYARVWDAEETAHHESIAEIKALIAEAQHEHGADCAEVQRLAHVWSLMNAYFFEWMESHHSPLPQDVRNVTARLGFTHELKAALLSKSMAVLQSRVRKMPRSGNLLFVKWDGWPGEYICRLSYTHGNEADAVVYLLDSEGAKTGDPIPFSVECDDWRNTTIGTRGGESRGAPPTSLLPPTT